MTKAEAKAGISIGIPEIGLDDQWIPSNAIHVMLASRVAQCMLYRTDGRL